MGLWDDAKLLLLKSWKYAAGASWKKEYDNIKKVLDFKIEDNATIKSKFKMENFTKNLEEFNKLKLDSYEIKAKDYRDKDKARETFFKHTELMDSIRKECESIQKECTNYQKQSKFSDKVKGLEAEIADLNKQINNSTISQDKKTKLEKTKNEKWDYGKVLFEKNLVLDFLYSTLNHLNSYMAAKIMKVQIHQNQAEEMAKKYNQKKQ